MKYKTDEPNRVYMHIGEVIQRLAAVGATDKELTELLDKAGQMTILDICKVENKHFHRVDDVE